MKEERANEIARDSDAGVARGSGNKPGSPIPQNSQSLANERGGLEATIEDTAEQPFQGRKASGPRTPEGKQRSKHNALKHGIFSKIILLSGESRLEFNSVLNGLRNDLRPKGALEEVLVDKLASLLWRYRRILIAEGAEIRKGTEFYSLNKSDRDEEEAAIFLSSEEKVRAGLFLRIENPFIRERCIEILQFFEQAIEMRGFRSSDDEHLLSLLFGNVETKATSEPFVLIYRLCSHPGEFPAVEEKELATPAARKATFLKALQDKIDRLQKLPESLDRILGPRARLEELCRKVPDAPELDRLLRYEASLERSFERTLSQLVGLQRMRLGQPVLPKPEVRHLLSRG